MVPPPDVGGLHDLAIDIELELAHRTIADPDRPRVAIAAQVIELPLDQVTPAIDPVHDLKVTASFVAADFLQEAHELVGLARGAPPRPARPG